MKARPLIYSELFTALINEISRKYFTIYDYLIAKSCLFLKLWSLKRVANSLAVRRRF